MMKPKSVLRSLLAILLVFVMLFSLVACNAEKGDKGDKGDTGENGADGIGLSDAKINENGELIITFTDGSVKNLGVIVGEDGEDGKDGAKGDKGDKGNKGDKGDKGNDGDDGIGIANAKINSKGELVITLTDGTVKNLGVVVGSGDGDNEGGFEPVDASFYTGQYDTSWFLGAGAAEYHINTANQLAGFAQLVNAGQKFENATVYLECNVIWNDGIFSMDENGDPLFDGMTPTSLYEWIPIGNNAATPNNTYTYEKGFTNQFYGNFDGKGHYVSGLYTNNRDRMSGFFTVFYGEYIRNLSIVNSYLGGDSRTGSFFGGCYVTDDWGTNADSVSVIFDNLYSDAYIVTDSADNSRAGGIGGMLRPLAGSAADGYGFLAGFNKCWFDGVVYSTNAATYNGGLLGVAAYGDKYLNGSTLVFVDCLVTADMYGAGGHVGLVLGNMYAGIVGFENVVAVIGDTDLVSPSSSGIVSTLEGTDKNNYSNSAPVSISYTNVFCSPAGGLSADAYNFHKVIEGYNGVIVGTPTLDKSLVSAATALNGADSAFLISGDKVILKGFGFELPEYTQGLAFNELSDGTYEVSVGEATDTTVVIPATYSGKAVTKIAANAFEGKTGIKSIYIPASVKEIGAAALKNCTGLCKIVYLGSKSAWGSVTAAADWVDGLNSVQTVCLDGTVSSTKFNGAALSEYTIVIPEKFLGSDYRVAVYLKKQLDTLYGTNLEIKTDVADYGREILIGATKRTTVTAPTGHNFSVNYANGDLQLQAGSVYAYDELNTYVTRTLFKDISAINNCTNGFTYSENIESTLKNGQEYTTKRDGDMRIMFFNMWGNSTTNYGPRDQHQMLAAEMVNAYAPDVIGFQEFNNHNRDDGWWSMDSLLEAYGYREVVEFEYIRKYLDNNGGKHEEQVDSDGSRQSNNFTPIFYNPNKVTLVKADFVPYGERDADGYHILDSSRSNPYNGFYYMHNDYFSKSLTWAVFKDNATGKQFGVISTHFWYASGDDGNAARVVNAQVVNQTVASMLTEYPNLPIFVGGDFNCTNSSDPYRELIYGGLVDVQGIADRSENHKTYHDKPTYDPMFVEGNKNVGIDVNANREESDASKITSGYIGTWSGWVDPDSFHDTTSYAAAIDHIFVYGNTASKLELKMFDIIASKMGLISSDHCPLICDFNLK